MPIGIGFFQLDNLVRNRIPFYFLKDSSDVTKHFGPMEKLHLQNYSLPISAFTIGEAETALKERGAQLQSPVVVLCERGDRSKKLAEELEQKGYMNIYFVLDGLDSFNVS